MQDERYWREELVDFLHMRIDQCNDYLVPSRPPEARQAIIDPTSPPSISDTGDGWDLTVSMHAQERYLHTVVGIRLHGGDLEAEASHMVSKTGYQDRTSSPTKGRTVQST